jgi:hypothetical protein
MPAAFHPVIVDFNNAPTERISRRQLRSSYLPPAKNHKQISLSLFSKQPGDNNLVTDGTITACEEAMLW